MTSPNTQAPAAYWYCLSYFGAATLCTDEDDATKTAAEADRDYPRHGPHRAVRLAPVASQPAQSDVSPINVARQRLQVFLARAAQADVSPINEGNKPPQAQPAPVAVDEREAFERTYGNLMPLTRKNAPGDDLDGYADPSTNWLWYGWKMRAALSARRGQVPTMTPAQLAAHIANGGTAKVVGGQDGGDAGGQGVIPAIEVAAAIEAWKSAWIRVPTFADRVNKATREAITASHGPLFILASKAQQATAHPPATPAQSCPEACRTVEKCCNFGCQRLPQPAAPALLPDHADHVPEIAARLRLVAKLAGCPDAIPADDRTAVGAIFSMLGNIRFALERKSAAPALVPLTDEQIVSALKACEKEDHTKEGWIWRTRIKWARAIERAHGINGLPVGGDGGVKG